MNTTEIIAFLALAVSLASAWFSFRATQVAHSGLRLAERQEQAAGPSLKATIVGAVAQRTQDGRRVGRLAISVQNLSSQPTSLVRIELVILFGRLAAPRTLVRSPHDPAIAKRLSASEREILRHPTTLSPFGVAAGDVLFQIPTEVVDGGTPVSYALEVEDARGAVARAEALFINEQTAR